MQKDFQQLFDTPVMVMDFEGEQLDKIQSEIAQQMTRLRAQEHKAPWGDNVSTTFDPRRNHDIESFALGGLAQAIVEATSTYLTELKYEGPGLRLAESWFNFNQKGGFQFGHVHPGSRVTGVYYYQTTGEDGELRFTNPNNYTLMGHFPYDGIQPPVARVLPKVGRLVLFPAWLEHRVQPNCTDNERISVSFTIV